MHEVLLKGLVIYGNDITLDVPLGLLQAPFFYDGVPM